MRSFSLDILLRCPLLHITRARRDYSSAALLDDAVECTGRVDRGEARGSSSLTRRGCVMPLAEVARSLSARRPGTRRLAVGPESLRAWRWREMRIARLHASGQLRFCSSKRGRKLSRVTQQQRRAGKASRGCAAGSWRRVRREVVAATSWRPCHDLVALQCGTGSAAATAARSPALCRTWARSVSLRPESTAGEPAKIRQMLVAGPGAPCERCEPLCFRRTHDRLS